MLAFSKAVHAHFSSQWGGTTVIQHENTLFVPPNNAPWVRLNIVTANTSQISVGPVSLDRTNGYVQATVFSPIQQGHERRDFIVDQLLPIFRKIRVGGAQFMTPSVAIDVEIGEPWCMASVKWPFWLDQETAATL